MCSICGGTHWDEIAKYIWERSRDRGRDDHGKRHFPDNGPWIGNHRATPTTEVESPVERQPVGIDPGPYFVFNGIISNDADLGVRDGEADTSILPRVIRSDTFGNFHQDVQEKLIASYAIACLKPGGTIWLSCNYKPIWILCERDRWYFSSLEHHFPPMIKNHPWKMKPYSSLNLATGKSLDIKRNQSDRALVICSSGLDSTAVAAYASRIHKEVTLIHFDYGCRAAKREIEQVKKIATYLNTGCKILNISKMVFGESSPLMVDDADIARDEAGAEYAHEWVPARNLVMLSLTVAYAEANNFGHIYLGTNLEEAGAYPDNEEQFILDFKNLLYGAVQNGVKIDVHTPLGGLMKHEVVPFGLKYGAPFELTWSCYRGGEKHCDKCGPCFMRRTAFERNGLKDPVFE
jgi:7-cyano-7-deazaguanine synthase